MVEISQVQYKGEIISAKQNHRCNNFACGIIANVEELGDVSSVDNRIIHAGRFDASFRLLRCEGYISRNENASLINRD